MLIQADEGEYFAAIPRSISMSSAGVDSPQIAILSRDTSEIDFLTAQEEFNWQTSVSERGAAQLHSEPRVRHTGMTETCNHCQLNYSSVSQIPKEVAHKHYSEKQAVQETAKRETASSDDELKTENLVGRYSSGLGYGMSLSFNSVNLIEVACSDLLTDAPTPRNSMHSSSRNSTLEPTDGMTMENSSSMVQLLKKLFIPIPKG
ncbi:unnamed protein product [Protopolystoma xenopodis]|uniref:Uncharacterized protein n=1 Tax=Protopolystoma xenopodis TaxID=117903 RepID=A0A3S5A4R8_9PLAT|nr:unnamed protein product [Protopolystoma xenopodis]